MDLKMCILPVCAPYNFYVSEAEFRNYVERCRDLLRLVLDPIDNHQDWVISDIKSVVSGTRQGAYFLMQKNNAGAKTDYSVLLGFGTYSSSSTSYQSMSFIAGGSGSIAQNYYQDSSGTSNTSTLSESGFCIHINNKALTDDYDFGFDNTTDLSYTSGDWTSQGAVPINSAGMTAFMPSHDLPKGFDPRTEPDFSFTSGLGVVWGAIVDLDSAFIQFHMCQANSLNMGAQYGFNELMFNNFNSSDTNRNGWHITEYANSSESYRVDSDIVYALNSSGVVTEFNVVTSKSFTRSSRKSRSTGSYHYLLAAAISDAYAKGTFNPDFVREQGMYQGDFNKFIASSDTQPFWKGHEALTFRYPASTLSFPYLLEEEDQVG